MSFKKFFNQFLFLLNKKEKKKIFLSLIFLFVTGILEALSIGLILPITSIVLDQTRLQEYLDFFNFLSFSNLNYEKTIFFLLLLIFFIYLLKNILLLCSEIFQINFLFKAQNRIEHLFYKNYVDLDFKFHKETNSSKLIQTIIGEIRAYFGRVIKQSLVLINEIIVIILITLVIYLSLPIESFLLVFGVTFIFFISYFFSIRKFVTKLGKDWKNAEAGKMNLARQGFDAISDVKIFQKENFFVKLYNNFNLLSLRSRKYLSIFQYLPKLLLEMIFISLLVFFLIFIIKKGLNLSLILPQITLIIAASFRLMPSVNKLLLASQSIRYGLPLVDHLIEEQKKFQIQEAKDTAANNLMQNENISNISCLNISFNYANKLPVLRSVNLKFSLGKMYGIQGANGSGKSSLAFILSGLFEVTSGEVLINDKKKINYNKILLQNSSYLSQNSFLFDDTLAANITFDQDLTNIENNNFKKVCNLFGIDEIVANYPKKMNYMVGENGDNLSSGQRQKVGLARTFYFDKKIIILDEATNAIDNKNENKIFESLTELKKDKIIIMISHKKDNLNFCDEIMDLDKLNKIN